MPILFFYSCSALTSDVSRRFLVAHGAAQIWISNAGSMNRKINEAVVHLKSVSSMIMATLPIQLLRRQWFTAKTAASV